jgi:uncharacterized membrane protein
MALPEKDYKIMAIMSLLVMLMAAPIMLVELISNIVFSIPISIANMALAIAILATGMGMYCILNIVRISKTLGIKV